MKSLNLILGLILISSTFSSAQQYERTEEYTILELSTRCNRSKLSITNNANGTKISDRYNLKKSALTDEERILIAMNDLNRKGFELKSTTVHSKKCQSKRAFLFIKSKSKN